jgi:hypothetical protein
VHAGEIPRFRQRRFQRHPATFGTRGKSFRSPFSIHAKVRNDKIVYFQFMEDTFASSRSFSSGGAWTIKTDPDGPEYLV